LETISVRFAILTEVTKLRKSMFKIMKRVEVNDPGAMKMLAGCYYQGLNGLQRDHAKAIELFTKSAELGCSEAHRALGNNEDGDMKKAKFHLEAAAMLGHENSRCNLGNIEAQSGNMERAVKHWTIAASAGCYGSMS
jgi:TPR repeat protein